MREGSAFHPLAEMCKALAVNFQSMRVLEIGAGYGDCSVSMRESQVGEFAMLLPHLSRPCVIVAHDVSNGHGGDNFWEEFKQRKDVEFITIPTLPGTGIGVLR